MKIIKYNDLTILLHWEIRHSLHRLQNIFIAFRIYLTTCLLAFKESITLMINSIIFLKDVNGTQKGCLVKIPISVTWIKS